MYLLGFKEGNFHKQDGGVSIEPAEGPLLSK